MLANELMADTFPTVTRTAGTTPTGHSVYLASEVMDDVTFSFQVETARRALYACNSVEEMRAISIKTLEFMVYQRQVVRGMLDQHFKIDQLPRSEEKES